MPGMGGRHSTEVAFALSHPAAPGLNLDAPKIYLSDFSSVALRDLLLRIVDGTIEPKKKFFRVRDNFFQVRGTSSIAPVTLAVIREHT